MSDSRPDILCIPHSVSPDVAAGWVEVTSMFLLVVTSAQVCPEGSFLIFPLHSFSQKGLGAPLLSSSRLVSWSQTTNRYQDKQLLLNKLKSTASLTQQIYIDHIRAASGLSKLYWINKPKMSIWPSKDSIYTTLRSTMTKRLWPMNPYDPLWCIKTHCVGKHYYSTKLYG